MIPGQAEFLGNMYAFGAMLSFTIAHLALIRLRYSKADVTRPYRGPMNVAIRGKVDVPVFAILGGIGTGHGVRRRHARCTSTSRSPASAGWRSAASSTCGTATGRASTSTTTTTRRRAEAGRRSGGRVRLGARRARPARLLAAARSRPRSRLADAPAPRHPRARPDDRAQLLAARRRDARAGARGADDHRAGAPPGRAACDRPLREGPRRAGRAADRRGGASSCARRRSSCRCRRARPGRCSARRSRPCSRTGPCRVIIHTDAAAPPATLRGERSGGRGSTMRRSRRADADDEQSGRDLHRQHDDRLLGRDGAARRRDDRARAGGGRRRARRRASCSACCSCSRAPGACYIARRTRS